VSTHSQNSIELGAMRETGVMHRIDATVVAALVIVVHVSMSAENYLRSRLMIRFMSCFHSKCHSPYQKVFLFRSIWFVLDVVSLATIKHDASNSIACGEGDGRLWVVAYFALEKLRYE
jgi:hypothetical protein